MQVIAWDTETDLFRPGVMAPELACVTYQIMDWVDDIGWWRAAPNIVHWTEAHDLIEDWLKRDSLLVGHNVAYDFAVICAAFPDLVPLVFDAYDANRVTDTMWRQKLLDIAAGCYRGRLDENDVWHKYDYSLQAVTKRLRGDLLEKDEWRQQYGVLRHVPLEEWPEGARLYPLEDARATLDCFLAQEAHKEYLKSQFHEARSYWALHLQSIWGLRTRAEMVAKLKAETLAQRDRLMAELQATGLVRTDKKGSRDTKAAKALMVSVCETAGKTIRRTKTGGVSLDADACEYSENELLMAYSEYSTSGTVINKDVAALEQGVVFPIHTRYDIAETTRTTSSKPNVQNWRRLPGIRECFIPRPGFVYIDTDYNALELWSLGQTCLDLFGKSVLADTLNSGKDPHTMLAADILHISYEEAAKRKKDPYDHEFADARQTAKVANFGFPGGLGHVRFVEYAWKSYGVKLTPEESLMLREAWFGRWTEMGNYFAHISQLCNNPDELAWLTCNVTGQIRGGAKFTAAANTYFQRRGAVAAKRACYLIAKACYVDTESPLFGSRPVCFVHDQIYTETPEGPGMHAAAFEQARLMQEGARWAMPDCVPPVEPVLARCMSKEAVQVFDANGQLIPWSGE